MKSQLIDEISADILWIFRSAKRHFGRKTISQAIFLHNSRLSEDKLQAKGGASGQRSVLKSFSALAIQ